MNINSETGEVIAQAPGAIAQFISNLWQSFCGMGTLGQVAVLVPTAVAADAVVAHVLHPATEKVIDSTNDYMEWGKHSKAEQDRLAKKRIEAENARDEEHLRYVNMAVDKASDYAEDKIKREVSTVHARCSKFEAEAAELSKNVSSVTLSCTALADKVKSLESETKAGFDGVVANINQHRSFIANLNSRFMVLEPKNETKPEVKKPENTDLGKAVAASRQAKIEAAERDSLEALKARMESENNTGN